MQLPHLNVMVSSGQGGREVHDDRHDAGPRLLATRHHLRDAHADTVSMVGPRDERAVPLLHGKRIRSSPLGPAHDDLLRQGTRR
ncbi:hypothetical protein EHM76_07210 [bacterium]|nr:MAG: hypothetical protein EHM76_07210 [bacterium]